LRKFLFITESNEKGKRNKAWKHPKFFQRELMKELARISLSFYIFEAWGIVKEVKGIGRISFLLSKICMRHIGSPRGQEGRE